MFDYWREWAVAILRQASKVHKRENVQLFAQHVQFQVSICLRIGEKDLAMNSA